MLAVNGVRDRVVEPRTNLGFFAVANSLDQQITEGSSLELELSKDIEHFTAERLSSLLDLFQKRPVDVTFAGFNRDEIVQVANLCLSNAVNATEPLLNPVRIPRQIVVHHQVSTLQIDAFARSVCRKQD